MNVRLQERAEGYVRSHHCGRGYQVIARLRSSSGRHGHIERCDDTYVSIA